MADIVLKDRSNNANTHENVKHLKVKGADGTKRVFSILNGLHLYAYIPLGNNTIRITKKIIAIASEQVWASGINTSEVMEWGYEMSSSGEYGVGFVITPNGNLVVGNEYTLDDVMQGGV